MEDGVSHGVVVFPYGVEVVEQLSHTFRSGVGGDSPGVGQVEVAVEVEQDALVGKRLAAVGHVG